jgi:hypothetical protein
LESRRFGPPKSSRRRQRLAAFDITHRVVSSAPDGMGN